MPQQAFPYEYMSLQNKVQVISVEPADQWSLSVKVISVEPAIQWSLTVKVISVEPAIQW
jgi:hypothetical protein